jgi:3-oxoacyl-[acyl-carrier-protein] synthase III
VRRRTLSSRDPERQEKSIKFLDLVASSVIFSTAIDMTAELRKMAAEGRKIAPADLAVLSPHRRENIRRFGEYTTEGLHVPPGPFDPQLALPEPEPHG